MDHAFVACKLSTVICARVPPPPSGDNSAYLSSTNYRLHYRIGISVATVCYPEQSSYQSPHLSPRGDHEYPVKWPMTAYNLPYLPEYYVPTQRIDFSRGSDTRRSIYHVVSIGSERERRVGGDAR